MKQGTKGFQRTLRQAPEDSRAIGIAASGLSPGRFPHQQSCGVTEAAYKTVFTQRLKQPGMSWTVEGGQVIRRLRKCKSRQRDNVNPLRVEPLGLLRPYSRPS